MKLLAHLRNDHKYMEVWLKDSGQKGGPYLWEPWFRPSEVKVAPGGVTLRPELTRALAETLIEHPSSYLTLEPLLVGDVHVESVAQSMNRTIVVPFDPQRLPRLARAA